MKKIAILLAVLLGVMYLHTFTWLLNVWLTDPVYSHGILIPVVSLFFAWKTIHDQGSRDPEPFRLGMVPFMLGIILHAFGFVMTFPFLSAISFMFVICGVILYIYGEKMMESLLFPVLLLIFAIPIPWTPAIATTLQSISARCSTTLLEILGVGITRIGSEMRLDDCAFSIGLPCSGMNTLISLLAISAVFVHLLKCPAPRKAALFCVTIPIAIAANIVRVTAIILIADHFGKDVAMKLFHDISSPFVFIIAFVFLITISKLMKCRIRERGEDDEAI